MRKKMTAIVVAVLAFSMIAASAASLGGITTADLGADTALIAACDADGIVADFTVTFSGGEYQTSAVDISGIDAACTGQDISVTLLDSTGASLGSSGPSAVGGATHSAAITASANAVAEIAVVIEG